uniref:Uncharacterized protein n=1 Tax=Helicotheca tamesis TaxID=374047 RepID=A0A7S2MNE6_9STRA|mmetsp:Transcript_18871/g.25962  ORF Transcript_18871/g.25962 Transcript_18871/m.25962 type:complete len:300 (+) Transcript_18871:68-967(+)
MIHRQHRIVITVLVASKITNGYGFIFGGQGLNFQKTFNPVLEQHAASLEGTTLPIRLAVGGRDAHDESARHLLDGLTLDLSCERLDKKSKQPRVSLPGADGPRPFCSSGPLAFDIAQDASLVDLTGRHNANFKNGCWEVNWREHAYAGYFVCGFDVPQEVKRNDACLIPPGRVYISFPIWEKDVLLEKRIIQKEQDVVISKLEQEREDALKFMEQDSDNLLLMALHFRNAAAAQEKIDFSTKVSGVPMSDYDVVEVGKDGELMLCVQGTVWTKDNSIGRMLSGQTEHVLLGHATLRPAT